MATLTVSLSGSAVVNGSKSYTVSDADVQTLLTWVSQQPRRFAVPQNPTNQQLLLAWVQQWVNENRDMVQQANTPPPVVPAPITFT